MSPGVSDLSEPANEWAQRSTRAQQVVKSKRMSERCEWVVRANEQTSKQANGRASGPVFLVVQASSALHFTWFEVKICLLESPWSWDWIISLCYKNLFKLNFQKWNPNSFFQSHRWLFKTGSCFWLDGKKSNHSRSSGSRAPCSRQSLDR